jgi:hypothetical protein
MADSFIENGMLRLDLECVLVCDRKILLGIAEEYFISLHWWQPLWYKRMKVRRELSLLVGSGKVIGEIREYQRNL